MTTATATEDKKARQAAASKRYRDNKKAQAAPHRPTEAPEPTRHTVDDDKLVDQELIVKQLAECRQDVAKAQNLGAKASELIERMPEYDRVADLEGQLEVARKNLKDAKLNNGSLQEVLDELASARTDATISRKVLSSLLVKWTAKYQQRNVLLGVEMHEIILTAKLGKEVEDTQAKLPLFDD